MTDPDTTTGLAAEQPPRYDRAVTPGQGRDGPRRTRTRRASDLGRRITAERQRREWTQGALAKHLAVDLKTVQRWELGTPPRGLYAKAVDHFLAGK